MYMRTMRFTLTLLATVGLGLAITAPASSSSPVPAAPVSTKADKDCSDFKSQKKAQKFFKKHNPRRDPHGLDADNDGYACDTNPCPCVPGNYRTSPPAVPGRLG